jgi:hypothetical protein
LPYCDRFFVSLLLLTREIKRARRIDEAQAARETQESTVTNEDLGTTHPPSAAPKEPAFKPAKPVVGDARAAPRKAKLQKLEAQCNDTETQLATLKKFVAGETGGNSGRDLVQPQISGARDEARHKRIAPGERRETLSIECSTVQCFTDGQMALPPRSFSMDELGRTGGSVDDTCPAPEELECSSGDSMA